MLVVNTTLTCISLSLVKSFLGSPVCTETRSHRNTRKNTHTPFQVLHRRVIFSPQSSIVCFCPGSRFVFSTPLTHTHKLHCTFSALILFVFFFENQKIIIPTDQVGRSFDGVDLHKAIESGEVLCELANVLVCYKARKKVGVFQLFLGPCVFFCFHIKLLDTPLLNFPSPPFTVDSPPS